MTTKTYLDGKVTLCCGDSREVLKQFPDSSIDSVVTDPPYALVSIVKRFANSPRNERTENTKNPYGRTARGFMGQRWDTGETAFAQEFWAEVLRVLKPGGHVVAFSATRTYHRMAVAIEDAGFEIRDQIGWLYGSGFPKSQNVSKMIDKMAGVEREKIAIGSPVKRMIPGADQNADGSWIKDNGRTYQPGIEVPATEAAKQWDGWGSALKPAWEPIVLGRKPLIGTIVENVLTHGTGAINIDGCRIETDENLNGGAYCGDSRSKLGEWQSDDRSNGKGSGFCNGLGGRAPMPGDEREGAALGMFQAGKTVGKEFVQPLGRFPANLIHDGSPEVMARFELAGERPTCSPEQIGQGREGNHSNGIYGAKASKITTAYGDTGTAARFFYQVEKDTLCGLCVLPFVPEHDKNTGCNANNAAPSSQILSTLTGASARSDVRGSPAPAREVSAPLSNEHATTAAKPSRPCPPHKDASVPKTALPELLSKTVQNVKCAGNLCDLCATDIARALVAVRQARSAKSIQFKDFIGGRNGPTLIQNLALYVEGREGTDIILTTQSLKQLLGSVFHAIESTTAQSEVEPKALSEKSKRFWYGSKAGADDRIGSKHPTVKPLDLMQYLVRLVTPKGGTVLDPFAGSGTTGEAAWREGMKAVLIEREPEYQADIARRMDLADKPTKRSAVAVTKGNLESHENLPLFKIE